MEFLESFVAFTNDILWSYVLIVMLVGWDLVFIADTICTGALPEGNGTSFKGRRWTED